MATASSAAFIADGDEGLGEGGLGLDIIDAVSDGLEIRKRAGGGASLRFVKRLP